MPVVNGYAFRSAGIVNLHLGHTAEGRVHLRAAIEAFGQGAGGVGVGQAALCWIDLSASFATSGEANEARLAAEQATEMAAASGDPWVQQQAAAHLTRLTPAV